VVFPQPDSDWNLRWGRRPWKCWPVSV
jgi:hypothetical protein